MRRTLIQFLAAALRAWRRVRSLVCEAAGILGCLVLIVLFLPLVPVFRMFEDIGKAIGDE